MSAKHDPRLRELEALYRKRFAVFVRVAAAAAGSVDEGADAVQDGFASAVRSLKSFRGEGTLEAWVWPIVLNAARKRRRRARHGPTIASTPAVAADDGLDGLRAKVATLPERQRQVVFLRYYADMEYGAIADALGLTTGTVGATLSQAHAALRRKIEEVGS